MKNDRGKISAKGDKYGDFQHILLGSAALRPIPFRDPVPSRILLDLDTLRRPNPVPPVQFPESRSICNFDQQASAAFLSSPK
jgi:hypothetical protein